MVASRDAGVRVRAWHRSVCRCAWPGAAVRARPRVVWPTLGREGTGGLRVSASRALPCAVPVCVALRIGQYAAALPRGAHGMTAGRQEGRRGKKAAAAFPQRTVQMIFLNQSAGELSAVLKRRFI